MFRLFKLTGSICIRHPTMPCVLGCECCGDQRSVLLKSVSKYIWFGKGYVRFLLKSCNIVIVKH